MAYFTQMGTISLAVHREQVVNFRNIYGTEDPDHEKHIQSLKDKIAVYLNCSTTMYNTAMNWRSNFIRFQKEDKSFILHDIWFYFIDDRTGTKLFLGSDSGHDAIDESRAREAYEAEKAKIMNAF